MNLTDIKLNADINTKVKNRQNLSIVIEVKYWLPLWSLLIERDMRNSSGVLIMLYMFTWMMASCVEYVKIHQAPVKIYSLYICNTSVLKSQTERKAFKEN